MPTYRLNQISTLMLISLLLASNAAVARDISYEQRAASNAREVYNQAKSTDNALSLQITEQEKRVAAEQVRLRALQDQQMTNKAALENAQIDLDAKVIALENAWNERNKH